MPQLPGDDTMGDDREPLLDSISETSSMSEDAGVICARPVSCMIGNNNTSNFNIPIQIPIPAIPAAQSVTVNVNVKVDVVSNNSELLRRQGIYVKIDSGERGLVDREFYNEMTKPGCFRMLVNYFHKRYLRLRGVYRGCIILDLSPESPEALKNLIDDVRSGAFNTLLSRVLQKRNVLESITEPELNVQIEIFVADSVFQASGLSRADLEPITSTHTVIREQSYGEGCTAGEVMDTSQYTDPLQCSDSPGPTGLCGVDAIIHLIIIGRARVGKSNLANITTKSNNFLSKFSAFPITKDCQTDRFIRDRVLYIISDTPGVDNYEDQASTLSTKVAALVKSQMGKTYFLLTFRVGEWREDELALKYFKTLLGPQFTRSSTVVFTGKESLDYEGLTLDDYIETEASLVQLKEDVINRMMTVSKKCSSEDQEDFIDQLLTHVDSLEQCGSSYTWPELELALSAEDERKRQALQEKAVKELKEKEVIEDIVLQNLQVDMRRQLDLQAKRFDDLQPGMRRPVDPESTREDMLPSVKKPRTQLTP